MFHGSTKEEETPDYATAFDLTNLQFLVISQMMWWVMRCNAKVGNFETKGASLRDSNQWLLAM